MKKLLFLLLVSVMPPLQVTSATTFDIKDFGAVGDGRTLDTVAVQKAIDSCAEKGGGDVVIPNGVFLSGTITLKSNVFLYLAPSAVLKGSPEFSDYPGDESGRALIRAEKAENIGIRGHGTVDGSGDHPNFHSEDSYNGIKKGRPRAILLKACTGIKLKEFTMKNGAQWNVTLQDCDRSTVDGVQFISRVVANNDGLDIVDCHDTIVSNCYFDCGDDSLCPKSHSKRKVKRLVVTNCLIKSESNAIKFGTKSIGGFEDVTISNCVLFDTRLSGIALEMVDGGSLQRVAIDNIVMKNVNGSILLKTGTRREGQPVLRDISISNVVAHGIGAWQPNREDSYFKEPKTPFAGVCLYGQPGLPLENVSLSNISLHFAGGYEKDAATIGNFQDKNPKGYPEYDNFGITPAYGLNCRYANNLRLENVAIEYESPDNRPAVMLQNVSGARLNGLRMKIFEKAPAAIRVKDSNDILITGMKPDENVGCFFSFEGCCMDITVTGSDFSRIKNLYRISGESEKESIRLP